VAQRAAIGSTAAAWPAYLYIAVMRGGRPLLPPTGSSGLSWCWHPVCRARCTGARRPWRRSWSRVTAQGMSENPAGTPGCRRGSWMGSRMAGMSAECMETRAIRGRGTDASPDHPAGTGPWNVAVEQSCAVSVAGAQEGAAARRIPTPSSRWVIWESGRTLAEPPFWALTWSPAWSPVPRLN